MFYRPISLVLASAYLFSIPMSFAQNQNAKKFNLKSTIEYAMEHAPTFDGLKRQLAVAQLEESSAQARMWPSLDLTTTHGVLDSSPRTNTGTASTFWTSDFNLALTESLYDNGVSYTGKQVASLTRKQAEINFQEQKNKLSLEIANQYVTYSLQVKLLDIQEKQFKLIQKQYNTVSQAYQLGIKTKNDFLRFKTQLRRSEIDLSNARNTIEKSKLELVRLMGVSLQSDDLFEFEPLALASLKFELAIEDIKLESHPIYKSAQIQKEIELLNVGLIERKNLPEWFVTAGVNYGSSSYIGTGQSFSDNDRTGWNALLTMKYNFFDWGIRSRDKEVAAQRSRIRNNELDSSLLSLKTTLGQLKLNVIQIQQNFELTKELLSLEKNNIDFMDREHRNGKVQYLDLVTALSNFADAETRYYTAISDYQTAQYTILYHQGKLYEKLVQ